MSDENTKTDVKDVNVDSTVEQAVAAPAKAAKQAKPLAKTVTTKISKGYLNLIDDACTDLRWKWEQLDEAVSEYNTAIQEAWAKVDAALGEYNEAIQEAEELRSEIHGDMESYRDEKSEKWQEGDRGQAYEQWMETWGESFDEVSMDSPDEYEFDVENYADKLGEEFPFEVEG